jgi:uncharacterized glyoxalase superfamily protein PhnB
VVRIIPDGRDSAWSTKIASVTWTASPILGARDVRAAAAYLRDVLGFDCPEGEIFGTPDETVYAIAKRQEVGIHVQIRRTPAPERSMLDADVYLYVEDADALLAEWRGRGAVVLRDIEDSFYGLRDFVVAGPEDTRLIVGSPIG